MRSHRPYTASFLAPAVLLALAAASLHAQSHSRDYEDVDPWVGMTPPNKGPDSAAVADFLGSLVTTNPVVCQFVVQAVVLYIYGHMVFGAVACWMLGIWPDIFAVTFPTLSPVACTSCCIKVSIPLQLYH